MWTMQVHIPVRVIELELAAQVSEPADWELEHIWFCVFYESWCDFTYGIVDFVPNLLEFGIHMAAGSDDHIPDVAHIGDHCHIRSRRGRKQISEIVEGAGADCPVFETSRIGRILPHERGTPG